MLVHEKTHKTNINDPCGHRCEMKANLHDMAAYVITFKADEPRMIMEAHTNFLSNGEIVYSNFKLPYQKQLQKAIPVTKCFGDIVDILHSNCHNVIVCLHIFLTVSVSAPN